MQIVLEYFCEFRDIFLLGSSKSMCRVLGLWGFMVTNVPFRLKSIIALLCRWFMKNNGRVIGYIYIYIYKIGMHSCLGFHLQTMR